jgi:urate oxidase
VALRIGFRTVAIPDGLLTVNGRRVLFRGVNRHAADEAPQPQRRPAGGVPVGQDRGRRHPHDHALVRGSGERRTATVVARGGRAWVVSGLADLVVLKSTGSEFTGYVKDRSTTLPETTDRILATAVTARWRHGTLEVEVRMSMPNRHRFAVDLSPFGLTNDNEVFHADDRPTA